MKRSRIYAVMLILLGVAMGLFLWHCETKKVGPTELAVLSIFKGWDLFHTTNATFNFGDLDGDGIDDFVTFSGVPLGNFNFGNEIGEIDVGDTDTIVKRMEPITSYEPEIPIEFEVLQLVTENEIDLGFGPSLLYVTLSATLPSTGTMDLTFESEDEGTFNTQFTIHFDVRMGGLTGIIIAQNSATFVTDDIPWSRQPMGEFFKRYESCTVFQDTAYFECVLNIGTPVDSIVCHQAPNETVGHMHCVVYRGNICVPPWHDQGGE